MWSIITEKQEKTEVLLINSYHSTEGRWNISHTQFGYIRPRENLWWTDANSLFVSMMFICCNSSIFRTNLDMKYALGISVLSRLDFQPCWGKWARIQTPKSMSLLWEEKTWPKRVAENEPICYPESKLDVFRHVPSQNFIRLGAFS